MGRFISPDWAAKAEPVPYATMGDPQSLNLYAYVRNNPLATTDADGHTDNDRQFFDRNNSFQWADLVPQGPLSSNPVDISIWALNEGSNPFDAIADAKKQAQQQSGNQAPDNTLLAQNNTPPPPGRTPAQGGTPDSTVEIPDGKGGKTVRKFGPDGKAETDIDHGHDHGAGDPHAHDWDWGKKPPRQPGRALTPEEASTVKKATFWGTVGVVTYWVVSEGSRILFPPRNLIPVP
jgi:hypothetical protein